MTSLWENREVPMCRVDREIMWGNTKKSGIYTTHPKHFGENFRGTDWHWYDVNDCWCFADEWLGKPVKVDVYGAKISRSTLVTPKEAAVLELVPYIVHMVVTRMDTRNERITEEKS